MRPFLLLLQDGQEHRIRDLYQPLAAHFSLTREDVEELLPSGRQARFANRILWAKFHLSKAGAVSSPGRGTVALTPQGRDLLEQFPTTISMRELSTVPQYAQFIAGGRTAQAPVPLQTAQPVAVEAALSPDEQLETLHADLNAALASELLEQVMQLSPTQFEVMVVRLLVAMGYGGSTRDAGEALGRTGDNGIDGVVKQDPLGLDRVYLQAKRWQGSVGSPEIRNFAGSLSYHKANKGVFITTSDFSENARKTAEQIGSIILVDGTQLSRLMIEYGVGVLTRATYHVRRIDSEFFEEL
nr:restriction endonuclease [Deinococcus sp. HSC-46F16]